MAIQQKEMLVAQRLDLLAHEKELEWKQKKKFSDLQQKNASLSKAQTGYEFFLLIPCHTEFSIIDIFR